MSDETLYVVMDSTPKGFRFARAAIDNCELAGEYAWPVFTEEWTAKAWHRNTDVGGAVMPMPRKLVSIFAGMIAEGGTRYTVIDPPPNDGVPREFFPIESLRDGS